jgi:hypothetical protein
MVPSAHDDLHTSDISVEGTRQLIFSSINVLRLKATFPEFKRPESANPQLVLVHRILAQFFPHSVFEVSSERAQLNDSDTDNNISQNFNWIVETPWLNNLFNVVLSKATAAGSPPLQPAWRSQF